MKQVIIIISSIKKHEKSQQQHTLNQRCHIDRYPKCALRVFSGTDEKSLPEDVTWERVSRLAILLHWTCKSTVWIKFLCNIRTLEMRMCRDKKILIAAIKINVSRFFSASMWMGRFSLPNKFNFLRAITNHMIRGYTVSLYAFHAHRHRSEPYIIIYYYWIWSTHIIINFQIAVGHHNI